jgi:sugar lactone lactonase YvrE
MKKLLFIFGFLLVALFPLACSKTYTVSPLAATPTPVFTATPTCGGALVTTLAGSAGVTGATNATGTSASFKFPNGIAVDLSGNVYVGDWGNDLIRKITPGGVVSTFAGQAGVTGATNATGTAASFNGPWGVAVDSSGNVYVGDWGNEIIREITPGGLVSTFANDSSLEFDQPMGVAVDSSGNVYVADEGYFEILELTPGGVLSNFAGQYLVSGAANGPGNIASFWAPYGVAVDASGNIYVADEANNLIRKITPGWVVSTFAGSGSCGFANGSGTSASFCGPMGVAVDTAGNVYVADNYFSLIREITPGGLVTTLAGTKSIGSTNGNGTCASFKYPTAVAVDSSGNVYVADTGNSMIRKISP